MFSFLYFYGINRGSLSNVGEAHLKRCQAIAWQQFHNIRSRGISSCRPHCLNPRSKGAVTGREYHYTQHYNCILFDHMHRHVANLIYHCQIIWYPVFSLADGFCNVEILYFVRVLAIQPGRFTGNVPDTAVFICQTAPHNQSQCD